MSLPTVQKAVKVIEKGVVNLVTDTAIPSAPGEDEILVRCYAAAQNPIDWQCVFWDGFISPGSTLGCDFAGIVVSIGPGVARFSVGDRVAGFVHGDFGPDRDNGAFAEYVKGFVPSTFRIPDSMTFEEAATLPLAIATVGQIFWGKGNLGLPWSGDAGSGTARYPFLVYGGSTCMGATAIQISSKIGAKVITTCSSKNVDWVKSLGASVVLDRATPDLVGQIKSASDNSLTMGFDPVAREDSPEITSASIAPGGGVVHCTHILDQSKYRADVQLPFRIVFNVLGKPYTLAGMNFPAEDDAPEFCRRVFLEAERMIFDGSLKPHPVKIMEYRLDAIEQGLELARTWSVSAQKIVYRIGKSARPTKRG